MAGLWGVVHGVWLEKLREMPWVQAAHFSGGWVSCGARMWKMAARLSELFSSVSENGHFLSHGLSHSLCPQCQAGLDHTSIHTSEGIQSNGRQMEKAKAGTREVS